jgi:hypothetical protein
MKMADPRFVENDHVNSAATTVAITLNATGVWSGIQLL